MSGQFYIGLMSGTSIDGIDAALVNIDDHHTQLIHAISTPIASSLQQQLLAFCHDSTAEIDQLGACDRALAEHFAAAVDELCQQAQIAHDRIRAIGSHGQTIRHRPDSQHGGPFTWQMGDPNVIAYLTGIDTVADFRRMDLAAGGQAAPLAPLFHQAFFSNPNTNRTIINIGGISNATWLAEQGELTGFDLGPGNALMDAWTTQHTGAAFDNNGQWAASGKAHQGLLEELLKHPFFAKPPPKSTGREDFNQTWLQRHLSEFDLEPVDVQATLLELTARSICQGLKPDYLGQEVYVCGGGAYNGTLMHRLQSLLENVPVGDTRKLGIAPDWVEACGFALLAHRRLECIASNCPSVTGSRKASVLGGLYIAQ